MGAGASAQDKVELQAAYAAWEQATAPGQPALTDEAFLALLKTAAPNLHEKASAAGTGAAAAKSLRSQFETARRKLQMRALGESSGKNAPDAAKSAPAPPPLQKLYSWAPDKSTNLTRGLNAGLLASEPLRLIDLTIAGVKVPALLDTGAEHCAMSSEGAKRCGLQPLVDESFGGQVGGIGTASKQGRVHYAKVSLSGNAPAAAEPEAKKDGEAAVPPTPTGPQFEVAFDVMSWPPHVNFEAIIGIDFLARHKAMIDVCGNSVKLVAPTGESVEAVLRHDGK